MELAVAELRRETDALTHTYTHTIHIQMDTNTFMKNEKSNRFVFIFICEKRMQSEKKTHLYTPSSLAHTLRLRSVSQSQANAMPIVSAMEKCIRLHTLSIAHCNSNTIPDADGKPTGVGGSE